MRFRTLAIMVITSLTIVTIIGYLAIAAGQTTSALQRIESAQEIAKLSGQYEFRSEIDQVSGYVPQITNYARPSRHVKFVIHGNINESNQSSHISIGNDNGIMLEVRRERGTTYMRQAGHSWQRITSSSSMGMINSLSFLAGVTNAQINAQDANTYQFGFDGVAFTDHFVRLLKADTRNGIKYNDEWHALAQANQFSTAKGNGTLTVDNDGLPTAMELSLVQAGDQQTGRTTTTIKTAFFAYARTGLALQKLANNPLTMIGNLIGTDTQVIRDFTFGMLGILILIITGSMVHVFRKRLYLPITLLALGMIVFQPYSSIPRSYAENSANNTPDSQDPNTPPSAEENAPTQPQFNPLIAPLNQVASIALPSASTSSSSGTVIGNASTSRTLSSTRAVAGELDTDKDKLPDSDEILLGTLINNADSDNDGLSDYDEVRLSTDPRNADKDNDKLNDFAEVQLGTNPNQADTDGDLLSDFIEVTSFSQYSGTSNKFYSNPLAADSNNDGTPDGYECSAKLDNTSFNCDDTNRDGIPDFLTNDNDGDAVSDAYDLNPNAHRYSNSIYTDAAPYTFKILNTATTVKPLLVDFQVRPNNSALLYANNAIYDWPTGDNEGQVQRGRDTTFASSTLYNSTDPTANNGDMRLTAMLEIRIPISSSNYGNLPTMTCPSSIANTIKLNSADNRSCVDVSKTKPFAMNVGWSTDGQGTTKNTEITVSIPLTPNYDEAGSIVAYTGTMYYATGAQAWLNNHQMRMQWIVSAIQDSCPADKTTCQSNERIETSTVVQNYYGDWKLIGMRATESSGVKAAVVAEDSTKTDVTDASKRRLSIYQLSEFLKDAFVTIPFLSIDGTDTSKSIPLLFDNTRNSTNPNTSSYGINKTSTLVKSFNYDTSYDIFKLSGTEIPTMLNDALCRNDGKTANCTTVTTLRNNCENKTTVACRPALIVLTENNDRTVTLDGGDNINFSGVDNTITRVRTGLIFKIKAGKWQQVDTDDLATEFVHIQQGQGVTANPSPANMTDTEWNVFQQQLAMTRIMSFAENDSTAYPGKLAPNLISGVTVNTFAYSSINNWGDANRNIYIDFQKDINQLIKNTRVAVTAKYQNASNLGTTLANIGYGKAYSVFSTDFLRKAIGNPASLGEFRSGGLVGKASIGMVIVGGAFLVGGAIADAQGKSDIAKGLNITGNALFVAKATTDLVTAVKVFNAAKAATGGIKAVSSAVSTAAKVATAASKTAKTLGIIGAVVGVGITVVFGVMAAVNAEYGWQKGNAISTMIGTTLAFAFVLALSAIPVVGQLIGAVIAAIDAIAALACSGLSEKELRSTAAKWLCGGVTGILANLFSPYASNIVVDPDDPWSRYMKVEMADDSGLTNTTAGFRIGNSITSGLVVTDYIERMPFPSTWMALPYFWQWNNQDTREASFNYAYGPTQQNMAYSISTGSQLSSWQTNNYCDTTKSGCMYYSDGEKTYTYRKSVVLHATTQFSESGINVTMPDMYLSTTAKVPQQTCILTFFFIPIPVCWIETHTANPKYININEDSKTKYDIFPTTIDEFITMRPKNSGYTFSWSADTDTLSFPKFNDADNDGLTYDLEIKYNSRDNASDTDSDGVADNREVANGTLTYVADSDNDGLNDSQEIIFTTNPIMPDSDGDGLLDGEEVVHINRDGNLVGGWDVTYAIVNGVAQVTWTGSDPNSADADNDGIIDLREKVLGWSPYAKNSGDILSVAGSAREVFQPLLQVGFESKSASGFSGAGIAVSSVVCVQLCPSENLRTPRPGNPSLDFNGTQSLNAGSGLQSFFDSQFTVSVWINPKANDTQALVNQAGQLGVFRTPTGNIRVRIATVRGIVDFVSPAVAPINVWSHVAITFSNQSLVIYINGVEQSRSDVPNHLTDLDLTKNDFTIASAVTISEAKRLCFWIFGCSNTRAETATAYTGGFDDMAVYQVGLRAQEILQLANGLLPNSSDLIVRPGDRIITSVNATNKLLGRSMQGYTTVSGVSNANGFQSNQMTETSLAATARTSFDGEIELPGQINYATTPSSYTNSCVYGATELCLKFDETSTTVPMQFNDLSGNNRTVPSSPVTCTTTVACPVFNSTDKSWKFGTTTTLQTSPIVGNNISRHDFSISAWVRPEGQSTVSRTIANSTNTNALLTVGLNLERPQFTVGTVTLTADSAIPLNQWSHVSFVMESQIRQIYVNGTLVKRDSSPIAYPGSYGSLRIGKDAGINSFAGSMRDVQINSRALTQRQILALAKTCEDPSLIACIPRNGSDLTDYSTFGFNQAVSLQTGPSGFSYKLPEGYAALLTEQNFTIISKVVLTSNTQTILQTGTALSNGNSLKLWVNAGVATLTLGDKTVTTTGSMALNVPYVIAARYNTGMLTLSVHRASGQTLQSTSNQLGSKALLQGQDPISIQQNTGIQVSKLRMYRIAVSDTTITAIANYLLFDTIGVTLNQAPVSDQLTVNVDARMKVIVPDENFERIPPAPDNCTAATSVICLPFTGTESRFSSILAGATATQSSLYPSFPASNVLDNNPATFNHTMWGVTGPWVQVDLGSSKSIQDIIVTNRQDCCQSRITGAVLFLSDTPLTSQISLAATKSAAKTWRNIGCDNQAATCSTVNPEMTVRFPAGTTARYLLIRNPGQLDNGYVHLLNYLHVGEITAHNGVMPCNQTNTCPIIENGANFTAGKQLSLSQTVSKATFDNQRSFTVMAWIRLNSVSGDHVIMADKIDHTTPLRLMVKDGRVVFNYPANIVTSNTSLESNRWYHVAFVKSATERAIYINGIKDQSLAITVEPTVIEQPRTMFIGALSNATASLNGAMRNFQVHNVALNATQINNDAAVSPVSELRFTLNEPTGTNTYSDIQNTAFALTCVSDCPQGGVPGRDDRAIHFESIHPLKLSTTSQNYISYVNTKDYTISMWVRPSKYNTWLIGGDVNKQVARVGITIDGKLSFEKAYKPCVNTCVYTTPLTPLLSTGVLPLNMWSHVLVSYADGREYVSINGTITQRNKPTALNTNELIGESNAFTIGEEFAGDIDEISITALGTTTQNDVIALMNRSPNWNLTFENTISVNRISVTDGITNTAQLDVVALPDDVPGRAGIQRFQYAASCNIPEIPGAECPVGNAVGMAGIANLFNGKSTMLQVSNGTTLMNEIKAGGSIQMMVKPDITTGTQTLLHYGTSTGVNAFQVQLVDGKVKVSVGTRTFTATSALPPAWNQISFSFGPRGITYFQNGTQDTTITDSASGAVSAFTTNATYKLRIGGKLGITTFGEMFKGGIDDITFTPSAIADARIFQIARSQFSQSVTKATVASVLIDADTPTVNITKPTYVARLPIQFIINTNDPSSYVTRVSATITSTLSETGNVLTTPRKIDIPAPACIDAVNGSAYCPTFAVSSNQRIPVEGKYGLQAYAYDAVDNIGASSTTILVDTTAPTASLMRPTGIYTITRDINQSIPTLLLTLSASDPVLANSGNAPGSGVAQLRVNIKDAGGRTINSLPIPAKLANGQWVAIVPLPFANPSGFYQVGAIVSDAVGNISSEIMVANDSNMIEVDGTAPHDTISYPSPYSREQNFVGNQNISGRISDLSDGRSPIQAGLRVRLDFEAPDGAQVFDNRADNRYNTSCTQCPVIATDTTDVARRVARFNIDALGQSLTIANAATILTGTFSIAFAVKINDVGTLLSTGIASNPRLRIRADKTGTTFKVTAQRGTTSVVTPATLIANTWYYFIYSEYRNGTVPTMSLTYGTNLQTMQNTPAVSTLSKAIINAPLPPMQSDIVLGAMQSSALSTAKEDFFKGSIDDVIVTPFQLAPIDLIGKPLSNGSGVATHHTRLAIEDDGFTNFDGLTLTTDFYMHMNQAVLPTVDAINGIRSTRCVADKTIAPWTCPEIRDGFARNAIAFSRSSDGLETGYLLQTSPSTERSIALRVRIKPDAQSGVIAWAHPISNTNSLALQVVYQQETKQLAVTVNNQTTMLLTAAESALVIDDNDWHALVITIRRASVMQDGVLVLRHEISVYVDGIIIIAKILAGDWVDAMLGVGAVTNSTVNNNIVGITTAAVHTQLDDLAVFTTALSSNEVNSYSFGYSTVYHETFDDANVGIGAITLDDSPYHLPSRITSADEHLTSVMGSVGTAALAFDGNDEVVHYDNNQLTFAEYNQPWSVSAWVTPQISGSTATIVKGVYNGYTYELSLNNGKPRFVMAGIVLEASTQVPTSNASHLVVSSNGSTATLYVNGTSVANRPTSVGTLVLNRATVPNAYTTKMRSALATNGDSILIDGSAAYDGNLNTSITTPLMTNPIWFARNNTNQPIDKIIIYSRVTNQPLYNFVVEIYDNTGVLQWSQSFPEAVTDHITIPISGGIRGAQVNIRATGMRSLTINEVIIASSPVVKIGSTFRGIIDDVRIYRRALNNDDITRLKAMAWQQSMLTQRYDGYNWQRSQVNGIEANASIQSMAKDTHGNSQLSIGETPLWNGNIDTYAPRVNATQYAGRYWVSITDRNINPLQIDTPCGAKLELENQKPNSLWYLQHMSFFDGTYSTPTTVTGKCKLNASPDIIQTNSQVISATTALAYGLRYAYMGSNNQLVTVDVQSGREMLLNRITVPGIVTQLTMNESRNKLYVISTANTLATLQVFDVNTTPLTPILLGTLPIELPRDTRIGNLAITSGVGNADLFAVLTDENTPPNLISINVSNPGNLTRATSTVGVASKSYDIAAKNDIVVSANGAAGVIIYRIDASGRLDAIAQYSPAGYSHRVKIFGNLLHIITDDEPYDQSTAPTSANSLRTVPLIQSVLSGSATLYPTLSERNVYMHTSPQSDDNVSWYRITDVAQYSENKLLLLSTDSNFEGNLRISLISTAGAQAVLEADTQVTQPTPMRMASNSQSVVVLTQNNATMNALGYQISDARLATSACDLLFNCTDAPSSTSSVPVLNQLPPIQQSIQLINQANYYTTPTQSLQVRAEAPAGISNISISVNNTQVAQMDSADPVQSIEHIFALNLPSGKYTITTQLTDSNSITTSTTMQTVVDFTAPQISLLDPVIGATQLVNELYMIRMVITDDVGLDNLQIINKLTNTNIPYTRKSQGNSTLITTTYNRSAVDAQGLPLRIIARDIAGRNTTSDYTVRFDTTAPIASDLAVTAKLNGTTTALAPEQLVSNASTADLAVSWSKISDISNIVLNQLEYTVGTVNGSTAYTVTLPSSGMTLPAGRFAPLTVLEASRLAFRHRLRDVIGNEATTPLSSIYVDAPTTPDYTLMNANEPTYRGFVNNGCAALGEDRRPTDIGIQRFATTWDSQALRFNWQGADWDMDGSLFIYLDTKSGGTVKAYRPDIYTQSITDSVTLGESFITLPVNMAARTIGGSSNLESYVNKFQTGLRLSQQGIRTSSVQGADYVIYVKNRTTATILRWNGSNWVDEGVIPNYRYADEMGIKQTDIRALFSQVGYVVGQPIGVVAFATKPNTFLPWSTFPNTNPVRTEQTGKITIAPMLNGYGWSNASSGVCPSSTVMNPDTTRVIASLTSSPNGVTNRAIADSFANTDPDAISEIVDETRVLCSKLSDNSWCTVVNQYDTVSNTGSAFLDSFASTLATEQAPLVGHNSVVQYTLTIQNTTNNPTRTMYGIVQTYGGIWLTDANSSGTPPVAIIGGGIYDYHTVSNSGIRDYELIKFAPIPANSTVSITLNSRIDINKAQASAVDRANTAKVAKLEVRLTDDGTTTNINQARTIEWLNTAVAIDSNAPSQIVADNQAIIKPGVMAYTGSVSDESDVTAVYLQYTTNNTATTQQISCGAAIAGRWSCPITIASNVTSLKYRLRASDKYNQQSQWSAWYGSVVDITPPQFTFSMQTEAMFAASYVGGTTINLSGVISDTSSDARIKVCDGNTAVCDFGSTVNPTINQSVVSDTVVTNTQVEAKPCAETDLGNYTALPINITSAAVQHRVSNVAVEAKVLSSDAHKLNLWLQSPSGSFTPLLTSNRGNTVNIHARFSDSASADTTTLTSTVNLNGPATNVKPDGRLAIFSGEPMNGTWLLLACQRDETFSTIAGWSLILASAGTSVSTNSPWSYTIKDTAGQDNVVRTLDIWSIDSTNNASTWRSVALNIDTVAPNMTINQQTTALLPDSQATVFQGTANDGGSLSSITANIYDTNKLVRSLNVTVQQTTSPDTARLNYLLNRNASTYTWELPIDASTLLSGEHRVQFVATDAAGNQRITDSYPLSILSITSPSIMNVSFPVTRRIGTSLLQYEINTGGGPSSVKTTISLDSDSTAPITDTTLTMWASNGVLDTAAQAQISTSLQSTLFTQLEMNDHIAVALNRNGILSTWALTNANTISLTTPISNVVQFALGDSSNQHLLTLTSSGVITDYMPGGVAQTVTLPISDTAVYIAAGTTHNLAILQSGTLYGWGSNTHGETTIPISTTIGISQIAAGNGFSLALKSDGRLYGWGDNSLNQTTIPISATNGVSQIATGDNHSIALRTDGTVVAWGDNSFGQTTVPISATNVIYIAANAKSSAAITKDGMVLVWGKTNSTPSCCPGTSTIALNSTQILTNQMIPSHTQEFTRQASLTPLTVQNSFTGLLLGRRYRYVIEITNAQGSTSYSGVFDTHLHYYQQFIPFLSRVNADGVDLNNTISGK